MKVVIAGGTGFIGQSITDLLEKNGHDIIILSRSKKTDRENIKYVLWLQEGTLPEDEIGEADVFINLAGVSINDGRWTAAHQRRIYDSRMEATDELIRIIGKLHKKPSVFINASAIGIYPASETAIYTEESAEIATDLLGRTVSDWEKKAAKLKDDGIRTVFTRFGLVLGKDEGALSLMVLPYRMFVGGRVGSGRQWVSWVHVLDVARAVLHIIQDPQMEGAVNVTAPFPVRMDDFGKMISATLHRPHWFPVPSPIMKLALGKKSSLVLEGQYVTPEKLLASGFEFDYPVLSLALDNLL
ncbi:TIGR01777 family oxidoreductase [Sporosarcina sp. ACRSL]|uniref:TIGR01777 family oxidoreductase n=1 Tax=Sporosarcina sp. ACRSL TaxID=2918215 RepID=UPI001EF3DD73|nr:TIGR01777 family oxidoreductase [Sporosarcina sp. ACRSL]MCG7345755.1 TIGR01777 family oxidoreductase [Sporosarcina sp. ACRSL]